MELMNRDFTRQARRTIMVRQSSPLPFLPEEIIVEILLKLPAKDLLRLKSVSQRWKIVISDTGFIKKHLLLTIKDPKLSSTNVLSSGRVITVSSSCYQPSYHHPHIWGRLVGSCNGLVCFVRHKDVFLWNPFIGRPKKFLTLDTKGYPSYGFGYDWSNDDYKIVAISKHEVGAKVFSLKANCWRHLPRFPRQWWISSARGTYVNGNLHWIGYNGIRQIIISFELATEKFGEVPLHAMRGVLLDLGVLGGYLFIKWDTIGMNYWGTHIWLMRDYGDEKSWIKLNDEKTWIKFTHKSSRFQPMLEKVKFMLKLQRELLFYNVESDTCKQSPIGNVMEHTDEIIFMESLVSPNSLKH